MSLISVIKQKLGWEQERVPTHEIHTTHTSEIVCYHWLEELPELIACFSVVNSNNC